MYEKQLPYNNGNRFSFSKTETKKQHITWLQFNIFKDHFVETYTKSTTLFTILNFASTK